MIIEIIYKYAPWILTHQNKFKRNPLHLAFQSGNICKGIQILSILQENKETRDCLLN